MFKNVASQKLIVFAFDSTTNLPKTGDAANITAYVSKDYGAVTVLGDTSATEMDATNAKGYYLFDLTQAESNFDTGLFSAKSSTANIVVIGVPATVFTVPANFTAASIDSNGRVDVIKVAGTTQTAGDIIARLPAALVGGRMDSSVGAMAADVLTAAATAADFGTEIAAAVWDRLTSALTTVGSIGKLLVDNVNATISSRAVAGDAMTLTAAYNAAKTAAQAGDAMALTAGERNSTADALLDRAAGVDTGWTLRQAMRIVLSSLAAKLSGAATTTVTIRDMADTKARITATVDADGNRTAVTTDAT